MNKTIHDIIDSENKYADLADESFEESKKLEDLSDHMNIHMKRIGENTDRNT